MQQKNIHLGKLLTNLKKELPDLSKKYQIQSLEVFGSFVRGDQTEKSDLDLLITFFEVPTLFQLVALENHISDKLGVKVDLVMKDSLKPTIGKRILEEARPV